MSTGRYDGKGDRPITVIELEKSPSRAKAGGEQEKIDLRLHEAAKNNDITELKELVNGQKIKVNALDSEGNTALHVAAENNNPLAVWHLMRLGADSSIRNGQGKTAGDIALEKNFDQVIEELTRDRPNSQLQGEVTLKEKKVSVVSFRDRRLYLEFCMAVS